MKTSARNQFSGIITHILQGAVNDEVELRLANGTKISTMITHASSKRLNLVNGGEATALVKASSIVLVDDNSEFLYSARNQLLGVISLVKQGTVNTEVEVKVVDGVNVVAIVTNESAQDMALATGKAVMALFKASSVILAVPKP